MRDAWVFVPAEEDTIMFFYLHFTRPPPEQIHVAQPFLIAPSIANDLRTETLEETTDIYHAWVRCNPSDALPSGSSAGGDADDVKRARSLGPMTQPQKLTTWVGNAYKEVQVFPPREARPGERWQLLLCTKPNSRFVTSVDLSLPHTPDIGSQNAEDGFGKEVLPILSSPVLFTARPPPSTQKDRKQVRNERILKLPSPLWGTSTGPLRMVEHLSFDLDKVRVVLAVRDLRKANPRMSVKLESMGWRRWSRPLACGDDAIGQAA